MFEAINKFQESLQYKFTRQIFSGGYNKMYETALSAVLTLKFKGSQSAVDTRALTANISHYYRTIFFF